MKIPPPPFVLIPWHHVDALSYGPADIYMDEFEAWIRQRPRQILLLIPTGISRQEEFSVALATDTIREVACRTSNPVGEESEFTEAGIHTRPVLDQPDFKFDSPFNCLVVTGNDLTLNTGHPAAMAA